MVKSLNLDTPSRALEIRQARAYARLAWNQLEAQVRQYSTRLG